MAKKKNLKKQPQQSFINTPHLILIVCAAVLLICFGFFLDKIYSFVKPASSSQASIDLQLEAKEGQFIASEEAQDLLRLQPSPCPLPTPAITPTPKPLPAAPINYGRSVVVPVLYYHYIGNNPNPADTARDSLSVVPDLFDKQMGYIASNGYTTITYDTLYAAIKGTGTLPPKPILLTFDDGYIDFFINAFPILEKYHLKATSFIPTGLMDQGYYLKWAQITQMQQSGLISFEAHSVTHANLVSLNDTQLHNEVFESKKDLEAHIHVPVNFFAYPYGTSNERVWNVVKQAGFLAASGTWYGKVQSEGTILDLPRIRMGGTISMQEFASKIAE